MIVQKERILGQLFKSIPKCSSLLIPLLLFITYSCGIPGGEGCGDDVVCIEGGAKLDESAKASDIVSGKKAYDLKGELLEGTLLPATLSATGKIRTFGSEQITIQDEASGETFVGYRNTPQLGDQEMRVAGKVSRAGFAQSCGLSGSVSQRISNCSVEYGDNAVWRGQEEGLYTETQWRLVARDTINDIIIWRDEATKYLWTSKIATNVTFCEAAGVDASTYSANCSSNDGARNSYCSTPTGFNLVDSGDNQAGLSVSSGAVDWRLPTRADFLRGDLNGLRYIQNLDNTGADTFWSSNTWSGSDNSFWWQYSGQGDFIRTATTGTPLADVMCVGIELGAGL